MKPCSEIASDVEALQSLHGLARERLRDLGLVLKAPKKRVFPVTPMRRPSSGKKVFGKPLRDLVPNTVIIDGFEATVPHFLSAIIDYLRIHKESEGLFRKAGSSSRQKSLRSEVESTETFYPGEENCPGSLAFDAASLLKQWLRELPEPLIPYKIHEALMHSSTDLTDPEKTESILLCCLLLPPLNASSLAYLLRFLSEVSDAKDSNKMDERSLAIVFTPCLFSVEEEASFSKNAENRNTSLGAKVDVVQTLIKNAAKVCMLDDAMETALNLNVDFASHSEDNLDEGSDAQGGPSARRRKKKKRRSGSLSRVLSATMKGIHKAISRSTTPSGTRTQPVDGASSMRTPFDFSSPSVIPSSKRRATDRQESPNKKSAFEVSITPQVVRHRSISIKNRFKRGKSLLGGKPKEATVFTISGPTTPLPSKPTMASLNLLSATTPCGSLSFDGVLQAAGQDLSIANLDTSHVRDFGNRSKMNTSGRPAHCEDILNSLSLDDKEQVSRLANESASLDYRTPAVPVTTSSSSASSSRTSLSSGGSGRKRRSAERRKPRSPGERKIGIVRRRSQEMSRKASNAQRSITAQRPNIATFDFPDEASVKSHLKRGNHTSSARVKPSPMKAEPLEKLVTRVKIGQDKTKEEMPRKYLNESLTNLRHDISSLIESSFGCNDKSSSIIATDNSFGVQLQKLTFSGTPSANKFATPSISESGRASTLPSVTKSGLTRRQSSAFEFSRPESEIMKSLPTWSGSTQSIRRQSSAFEIAAARQSFRAEPIYENFERVTTRASLKHRNSSVKDLVKKLETTVARKSESNLGADKRKSLSASSLPFQPTHSFVLSMDDLIKPPPPPPPIKRAVSSPQHKTFPQPDFEIQNPDFFDEEWTSATEFFGGKNPPAVFHMNEEAPSGCKRSSIIRMRKEKKGIVSKTVETFTRPAAPTLPYTPSRHPATRPPMMTPGSNPRRVSARMGIATSVRPVNPPTFATPSTTATGRQTLTGIRTTPQHSARRASITAKTLEQPKSKLEQPKSKVEQPKSKVEQPKSKLEQPKSKLEQPKSKLEQPKSKMEYRQLDEPIYANVDVKRTKDASASASKVSGTKSRLLSDKRHDRPVVAKRVESHDEKSTRKSKRIEGRRHLTIGYEGEVRSPLRDRQNVLLSATVQRSKSAQTPNQKNVVNRRTLKSENDDVISHLTPKEVNRSQSLRTHTGIVVPQSLRETIYDVTTPKSEKVKRNLSDRIMTPRGGRPEAVPFIKSALSSSRAKDATPGRHIRQLGASPYLKRSPRKMTNNRL